MTTRAASCWKMKAKQERDEDKRVATFLCLAADDTLIRVSFLTVVVPGTTRKKQSAQTHKNKKTMGNSSSSSNLPPLNVAPQCVTEKFMGPWFVVGVKPTMFETTCSNAVEIYTRNKEGSGPDIQIDFQYNEKEPIQSKLKSLPQKGWIQGSNKEDSAEWKVSPFWPIKMPYKIIEVDERNYQYAVIGYPSRAYCWILSRSPQMTDETYEMLTQRLIDKHQYSLEGLRKVPQVWTREEREKRGLVSEIPDSLLN